MPDVLIWKDLVERCVRLSGAKASDKEDLSQDLYLALLEGNVQQERRAEGVCRKVVAMFLKENGTAMGRGKTVQLFESEGKE